MEMAQLVALQKNFDERHGWSTSGVDEASTIDLVSRDVVGLLGEIGEFANLVKDLQLLERFPERVADELDRRRGDLSLELVDSFIYILRLAGLLGVDLEKTYVEKLAINEERFQIFAAKV